MNSQGEHAFVPRENSLTAIFASNADAREAATGLALEGFRRDRIKIVSGSDQNNLLSDDPDDSDKSENTSEIEVAFDEILHVFTETFSDDDKVYAHFDRILAAGGALLSVSMHDREESRKQISALLKSLGARAVYYWGVLVTEQL